MTKRLEQKQVIHADCFDIFTEMQDDSINLTITDIPYNSINSKSLMVGSK